MSKKKSSESHAGTPKITESHAGTGTESHAGTKQKITINKKQQQSKDVVVVSDFEEVKQLLVSHGISKGVAHKLSNAHESRYIRNKVAYLDFELSRDSASIQKPSAWLRRAIESDFSAQDGFESIEQKVEREANEPAYMRRLRMAQNAVVSTLSGKHATAKSKEHTAQSERLAAHVKNYSADVEIFDRFETALAEFVKTSDDEIAVGHFSNCYIVNFQGDAVVLAVPTRMDDMRIRSGSWEVLEDLLKKTFELSDVELSFVTLDE